MKTNKSKIISFVMRVSEGFDGLPISEIYTSSAASSIKAAPWKQRGLLEALEGLVPPTGSRGTIFRSDHASNYLPLKGNLPRDRGRRLLDELSAAQERDL